MLPHSWLPFRLSFFNGALSCGLPPSDFCPDIEPRLISNIPEHSVMLLLSFLSMLLLLFSLPLLAASFNFDLFTSLDFLTALSIAASSQLEGVGRAEVRGPNGYNLPHCMHEQSRQAKPKRLNLLHTNKQGKRTLKRTQKTKQESEFHFKEFREYSIYYFDQNNVEFTPALSLSLVTKYLCVSFNLEVFVATTTPDPGLCSTEDDLPLRQAEVDTLERTPRLPLPWSLKSRCNRSLSME